MINIDGSIPDMIVSTLEVISRNIRHGAIVEGALRADILDYPPSALREAIANALLHRDYSKEGQATPVMVELYPDRIEISNPGGLYGNLTIDDLGKSGYTASRNQWLARILGDVVYQNGETEGHVIENLGTGIPIIKDALEEALMPPFKAESNLNRFTIGMQLRRNTEQEERHYSKVNTTSAILDYLSKTQSAKASEIANAAGLSKATVSKYIKALI